MRNKKVLRIIALVLCFNIIGEILFPSLAYALTDGPSSPEFSSFQPVGTSDMVNTFTGDFSYNLPVVEIPGPDGAGYALSLSYQSGNSCEEEASWVGFGWTLNPGSINRNTRGFPDDYKGEAVVRYNKARPNFTLTTNRSTALELGSQNEKQNPPFNFTSTEMTGFNNHSGYRYTNGISTGYSFNFGNFTGYAGLSFQNSKPEGATFNPVISITYQKMADTELGKLQREGAANCEIAAGKKTKFSRLLAKVADRQRYGVGIKASTSFSGIYGMFTFSSNMSNVALANIERSRHYTATFGNKLIIGVNQNGLRWGFSSSLNYQVVQPASTYASYGYMNNPNGSTPITLSDSYLERGTSFESRSHHLGIPFNNADHFLVSGEGIGGSFRYYPSAVGIFYPTKTVNSTPHLTLGVDFNVGGVPTPFVGVGVEFGAGFSKSELSGWNEEGNASDYQFNNEGFFKFASDPGGTLSYGNETLTTATLRGKNSMGNDKMLLTEESYNRTSHIEHKSLSDVRAKKGLNPLHKEIPIYSGIAAEHTVAELAVTNADGMRYIYGQPVYVKNETNLQFSIKSRAPGKDNIENRYLTYPIQDLPLRAGYSVNDFSKFQTVSGEIKPHGYANNFLLTQIYSSDYVDIGKNGCDTKDFGAWTQFTYFKKYGSNADKTIDCYDPDRDLDPNDGRGDDDSDGDGIVTPPTDNSKWYRWRAPYNGLLYDQNSISDTKDDLGSVSTGQKEVHYLKSIETKTHIAFFVTNQSKIERWKDDLCRMGIKDDNPIWEKIAPYLSAKDPLNKRKDGLGALDLTYSDDPMSKKGVKGTAELEYLEKIVIFSKNRMNKPLKTTHFAYDYSIAQKLPNSTGVTSKESGKLTLRKVWFEYEGVTNAKISPYQFEYAYKTATDFKLDLNTKYAGLIASLTQFPAATQNPDYEPHLLDPWGNIHPYAKERQKCNLPWHYQGTPVKDNRGGWETILTDSQTGANFKHDPAAWQLKQIKLPSGGEILVEYEEKDYSHVQDQSPMAMTSFSNIEGETYTLNARDLGLEESNTAEMSVQAKKIREYFIEKGNKIYFKFFYKLIGEGQPSLDDYNSDYVTGYASVENVFYEGNKIKILLHPPANEPKGYVTTPREACYQFYGSQRNGLNEGNYQNIEDRVQNNDNVLGIVFDPHLSTDLASSDTFYKLKDNKIGQTVNQGLSFFKIPMVKPKKGGGIRVKRLLMYDDGIETGDATLYGQEYTYKIETSETNWDGLPVTITQSTGVATNEPAAGREENALVGFLESRKQSNSDRLFSGRDRLQTEGPIGESILPAPSIGYSKVVIENIHKGNTGTGHTIYEFYTAQEHPFKCESTNLADNRKDFDAPIPPLGYGTKPPGKVTSFSMSLDLKNVHAAQGYRFELNDMHGKIKSIASYEGAYGTAGAEKVSETKYDYFGIGEKIRGLDANGTQFDFLPGKEMDVAMDMRSLKENSLDFSASIDLGLLIPLKPAFNLALVLRYANNSISTHSTAKIIRYPAIVRKVTSMQKGITSVTENLAFNKETGACILTKTYDGYHRQAKGSDAGHDGSLYALTLPASWFYDDFGQKRHGKNNILNASVGSVVTYGKDSNPLIQTTRLNGYWEFKNVVQAQIQTYKKDWLKGSQILDILREQHGLTANSETEELVNSFYKPWIAYTYRSDVTSANAQGGRVQKDGLIPSLKVPLSKDYWKAGDFTKDYNGNATKWLASSKVTEYSPMGSPIEEINPLGIPSAAVYGYNSMLPIMTAHNAKYTSIFFGDYENSSKGVAVKAHSGKKSLPFSATSTDAIITDLYKTDVFIKGTNNAKQGGAIVKMWVYADKQSQLKAYVGESSLNINAVNYMKPVASVNGWTLFEGIIPSVVFEVLPNTIAPSLFKFSIRLKVDKYVPSNNEISDVLYIDDVKFQPQDAQATCFVYDPITLKLIAQFDDQHFGLFYQYDLEGKLTRKLVETEKGISTITDSQFNIVKKTR